MERESIGWARRCRLAEPESWLGEGEEEHASTSLPPRTRRHRCLRVSMVRGAVCVYVVVAAVSCSCPWCGGASLTQWIAAAAVQ